MVNPNQGFSGGLKLVDPSRDLHVLPSRPDRDRWLRAPHRPLRSGRATGNGGDLCGSAGDEWILVRLMLLKQPGGLLDVNVKIATIKLSYCYFIIYYYMSIIISCDGWFLDGF